MKEIKNSIKNIFIRYLILVLVALPNLYLFYLIFTPLTIFPSYFLFNLFFDTNLVGNLIIVESIIFEIIPACIAGAAYYLLFILNLSTPKINIKRRINIFLFSFTILLIINILRIFLLGTVFVMGYSWFDFTHKLFWYLGSTIFVVGIWFLSVKLFKIDEIPIYSDLKFLFNKSTLK